MNIVFVNSTRKWGGVKSWCINSGKALAAMGDTVRIYGRPGPFIDKALEQGLDARAVEFGADFHPQTLARFWRDFRQDRPDVVICNISKDLRSAGAMARLLGVPVVHRVGSPADVENTRKTRLTQRLLAPSLLACSEHVKTCLTRRVPLYAAHTFTAIHPGVVLPEGTQELRPRDVPTLITTSQLNPDKGHHDLLHALAELKREGIAFRQIICGTGKIEKRLKSLCVELGLEEQVQWTGFVKNVQDYLDRADIYVLPSHAEPFGQALAEGMAHGLAPVARRTGGVHEFFPSELSDCLVEERNGHEQILGVLRGLLSLSPDELLEKRRTALEHARQHLDIHAQTTRLREWLESVIRS